METARSEIHPRLSPEEVHTFKREGYLIVTEPVFAEAKFRRLKAHFEEKLERLPPEVRPEEMDVPHFTDPALFEWLMADEVLDLVEPILGPDIALWSSHFICKPKGNGKRVPWHEDSAYWGDAVQPMEVVTVWLAIDPSTKENGCMYVVPRTQDNGYSDYVPVDKRTNVFDREITPSRMRDTVAVPCELQPNQASLHDGRLIHGSPPNTSMIRRCGYTMRYMPATSRFNVERLGMLHQIYLARGRDRAGNQYGDPAQSYPHLARYREQSGKKLDPHQRLGGGCAYLPSLALSSVAFGAGSLAGDAASVARFEYLLFAGRLIDPLLLAQMTQPVWSANPNSDGYGLGVFVTTLAGEEVFGHPGDLGGYSSLTFIWGGESPLAAVVLVPQAAPQVDDDKWVMLSELASIVRG
jgi:ectoine hydroxylase-related dioxygenase (phytanoyl-CoA dioxygenase family)